MTGVRLDLNDLARQDRAAQRSRVEKAVSGLVGVIWRIAASNRVPTSEKVAFFQRLTVEAEAGELRVYRHQGLLPEDARAEDEAVSTAAVAGTAKQRREIVNAITVIAEDIGMGVPQFVEVVQRLFGPLSSLEVDDPQRDARIMAVMSIVAGETGVEDTGELKLKRRVSDLEHKLSEKEATPAGSNGAVSRDAVERALRRIARCVTPGDGKTLQEGDYVFTPGDAGGPAEQLKNLVDNSSGVAAE